LVLLFAFVVPVLILWIGVSVMSFATAIIVSVASAFIGVLIERWLFFAEARHVVNLYHGMQQC